MRILFWGTPAFAVRSLRALHDEEIEVVGVVTQPDRPAGRGRKLRPSALKRVAMEYGLTVLTPERPRGEEFLEAMGALEPDLSVVVAYGHILRPEVLDLPPLGSINVHASLLPELRGAAPINWAIARGYRETGVTIMRMVQAMDAGAIIHQVEETILEHETASDLSERLSESGARALLEALTLLKAGGAHEVEQNDDEATFAPKIDRGIARVEWNSAVTDVVLHVRAMDAVPGAWSVLEGQNVKLFGARRAPTPATSPPESATSAPEPGTALPEPGTVIAVDPAHGVVVATLDGAVLITEVQPPGRRRMHARDWINGRGVEQGQRFE
jgi:methionyl-tRNA formyltransferase